MADQLRKRQSVVVQPAYLQNRRRQIQRRFRVRCVEGARFGRMLVNPQGHLEGFRNVAGRAGHIQHHAVGMREGDGQAIGLGEIHERLIILFRRPEPLGKLLGREVVTVVGAGRVVDLLEQAVEFRLVAQRQADSQVQTLRAWKIAHRRQACHSGRNITAMQLLPFRRRGSHHQAKHHQPDEADQGHATPTAKSARD